VIQWSVTKDKEKGEKINTFPSAKAAQDALRNDGKPKANRTNITQSCRAALSDKMMNALLLNFAWESKKRELWFFRVAKLCVPDPHRSKNFI
jgi:hypothetical protein